MSAHRHGQRHRRTEGAIVAVVAAGIIAAIIVGYRDAHRDDVDITPSAGPVSLSTPSTTTPVPTVTITESPAIFPEDPVAVAQGIKPLRDLVAGDLVLYTAEPAGTSVVCTWVLWNESIATSTITCGPDTFEVPTGYLTPVAPR